MSISRRRLLAGLCVGATAGLAGCSGDGPTPAEGTNEGRSADQLHASMANAIFAPGRCVDVDHRSLVVRDLVGLREHESSGVATALRERPTDRAEEAFDLDPGTVEAYGYYGRTELFAGSFSGDALGESFRGDGWTLSETYHGVDVFRHPDQPERYAAGIADGIVFTTARFRGASPVEFVRGHAEALAGETRRYADDEAMGELLSVVGSGDYVAGITSPVDVGYRLPKTIAVGRAIEVTDGGVEDTFAFVFDESAPQSPQAYAERYAKQWEKEVSSDAASETVPDSTGRVGYFTTVRPEDAFTGGEGVVATIRNSGPTQPMQDRIDERYAERHGQEPPNATFSFTTQPNGGEAACGAGPNDIAITYESGPPIPARRLAVGSMNPQEFYALSNCGFAAGDTLEAGETVRIGFETAPGERLLVVWNGPHGNRSVLRARRR